MIDGHFILACLLEPMIVVLSHVTHKVFACDWYVYIIYTIAAFISWWVYLRLYYAQVVHLKFLNNL